jgi:phosphatidylserine decarboxylase
MVAEGIYYALALAAGGGLVSYLSRPAFGAPLFLLAAFCLYFFRDPERAVPSGPVAVSPADGKIVSIRSEDARLTRISIFMSVFDVHVNRAPVGGRITGIQYQRGRFLVASREDASLVNESNRITVEPDDGEPVVFKQIAGILARRIVCHKRPGDVVRAGERIGLIKFGSRVDVYLGPEWEVRVALGDRVKAGSSILARRRGAGEGS